MVPGAIPVTTPLLPIVPTAVLLLLHVPPEVASESVVAELTQTEEAPKIEGGKGLTVKAVIVAHPVGNNV